MKQATTINSLNYQKAKTIGELKECIEAVIAQHGADCQWWGWDDGTLVIETGTGSTRREVYIETEFYKS